jgi:hypothetical protein
MTDTGHQALAATGARKLANTTKTPVQMPAITPRWLVTFMQWKPLEAGTLRVNRVKTDDPVEVACSMSDQGDLPSGYVDIDDNPREYTLSAISTILNVQTRVSDLFSSPYDQIREQLRLTIESVKERQESELVNNGEYGLLTSAAPFMRVAPRTAAPTPDDLDELISRVWKEPAFFLAHPLAIAAFGRECTRRGVPPATVTLFGSPFLTWRGLPIVPCDKLYVDAGKTNILLLRTGEKKQGVVGLFQPGLAGEQSPGLSVRFMGIQQDAVAQYLIALYCSAAVLVPDALGVLENVDVGQYHEYK